METAKRLAEIWKEIEPGVFVNTDTDQRLNQDDFDDYIDNFKWDGPGLGIIVENF